MSDSHELEASGEAGPPPEAPNGSVTFSQRLSANRLRVGAVAIAALALAAGAVATSLAASPAPSDSGAPSTAGGPEYAAPFAALDPSTGLAPEGAPGFGRFGGRGGFGDITIASISGSSITLHTADGWTRTIDVTSSVALTRGGKTIAVGDLKTGDHVRFRQIRNNDGTFTVTAIAVVVPSVVGTVGDVTSGGFTVKTRDGSTWTITVDSSTAYKIGAADGAKTDVVSGARVLVQGDSPAANQIKALSVDVAPAAAAGMVTAKTADSITIKTRDGGTATIHVGSGTTYRVAGVTTASLNDIKVDMVIVAAGRARTDGSIDATTVAGGLGRGFGKHFLRDPGGVGPLFDLGGPGDDGDAPASSPTTSS